MSAALGQCESLLPQLEPLLGIGLALNLAYLNLPVFHFLMKISEGVQLKIKKLELETVEQIKETGWYKDSLRVSNICELDSVNYDHEMPRWVHFKSGINSVLFNIFFYYKFGPRLSVLAAFLACLFITLGVLISIESKNSFVCASVSALGVPFYPSMFIFVWPIACVSVGAYINHSTQRDLNYHLRNLGKKALSEAKEAVATAEQAINVPV